MELVRIGHVDDPNLAEIYAASLRSEGIPVVLTGGATVGYPTRIGFGGRTYLSVPPEHREVALELLAGSDATLGGSPDGPVRADWLILGAIAFVLFVLLLIQALR